MTSRASRLVTWWTLGLLGLALTALWWPLAPSSETGLGLFSYALFAVAAAATELLPMQQPGGRPVPSSVAILATLALLGAGPAVLVSVAVVAWTAAHLVRRQLPRPGAFVLRVIGAGSLAGVAALGSTLGLRWVGDAAHRGAVASLDLGAGAAIVVAVVAGVPALQALAREPGRLVFVPRRAVEAVTRSWMAGAVVASTALLGGLVYEVLGSWTLPTMLIPLLAARFGLDRLAVASRAYDQTIRAMSRLPEQLGAVDAEHGVRVGRLAVRVGLELGVDADTLVVLERAAHLHELGRIRHDEPDAHVTRPELGAAGASIIRETDALSRVADIVEAHGTPALATGPAALPGRIVAACCAVDRYEPTPGHEGQQHEMFVRLVRDIGDLEVVSAVSRVLQREPLSV